jgi:hypothetical protein
MFEPIALHGSSSTAVELRGQLTELQAERTLALGTILGENATYMADLDEELAYRTQLYVAAAVTEIASLRAELSGPVYG